MMIPSVFNVDEEWTFEKQKSIDWTDASDILAHNFLFLTLRDMHPAFDKYCENLEEQGNGAIENEKASYQRAPLTAIQNYINKGLFASSANNNRNNNSRIFWCSGCRFSGHTLSKCPNLVITKNKNTNNNNNTSNDKNKNNIISTTSSQDSALVVQNNKISQVEEDDNEIDLMNSNKNVFFRFRQHCRACNIEMKANENGDNNGGNNNNRFGNKKPFQNIWIPLDSNPNKTTSGRLRSVDLVSGVGEIEALGNSISFFTSRARFGLKRPREGEVVHFKAERANDRYRGVDVVLERTGFVLEDVDYLIQECESPVREPIMVLRHLLSNADEWAQLLRAVSETANNESLIKRFAFAIVCVFSFRRNLFPIHAPVMRLMARLLCIPSAASGGVAFVPHLVSHTIPTAEFTTSHLESANGNQVNIFVNNLHQVAAFFFSLKLNNFPTPPECAEKLLAAIDRAVQYFRTTTRFGNTDAIIRRLDVVVRNLVNESRQGIIDQLALLPTAQELRNFRRTFDSANLPVLSHSRTAFATQQDLVGAHLKLLRADVCQSAANLLSFFLFGVMNNERVMDDLAYVMTYSNVTFVGRTCSRHFESCNAALLQFQPDKQDMFEEGRQRGRFLSRGRLLLLNTSEDPEKTTDEDLFWLVVQSSDDSPLLQRNVVAVSPVVFSVSTSPSNNNNNNRNNNNNNNKYSVTLSPTEEAIEKLRIALEKNEKRDAALLYNRIFETELFLQGYEPVFRALSSYLIPTCPVALPMPEEFYGVESEEEKIHHQNQKQQKNKNKEDAAQNDNSLLASSSSHHHVAPNVVPPHFADGFNHIVQDIRRRNILDAGQDLAMRSLAHRRMILVQGPPGTGKSFIGCRIVEAYVRYKHGLRNGAMLQHVDPLLLPSTTDADLCPPIGPIVVITYKNHALDEFLLDLKRSGLWGSAATGTADSFSRNAVVRVGSGSSEPELQEINISRLVDMIPNNDTQNSFTRMIEILKRIEQVAAAIKELESGTKNPSPQHFATWLTPEQRERFFVSIQGMRNVNSSIFLPSNVVAGNNNNNSSSTGATSSSSASTTLTTSSSSLSNILTANPSLVAGAEDDINKFLAGDRYIGSNANAPNVKITKRFHELLTSKMSKINDSLFGVGAKSSLPTQQQQQQQQQQKIITEAQESEEEESRKLALENDGAKNVTGNNNNNNDNNKDADKEEEEETTSDQVRQSTFAAVRQELLNENRRFGNPEAGLSATISNEALSLATVANPRQEFLKESWAQLQSVWSLTPQERHEFVAAHAKREIATLAAQYVTLSKNLEVAVTLHQHLKNRQKMELLKTADVVGITTTGCAINQDMLRSLEPQVIIVEEAAEVLESQLLACLPESLKQIVLIGDHYQLQPSVDTLDYEKNNGLNISLFERLVRGTKPILLTEQRRMRPEIADMVRPFYTLDDQALEDHPSVTTRALCDRLGRQFVSHVPGLVHNVFFWKHDCPERQSFIGRSVINLREVELCVMLVQHLLAQKLHPTSITVITPYLGQRTAIKGALREAKTEPGVRISTVDRFQGDEADVIILSLVRTSKLTDFLKYRNRLIVAASRARYGMVFIGNDTLLKGSPHWNQLLNMLKAKNVVSDCMPVRFAATAVTTKSGENNSSNKQQQQQEDKIVEVSSSARDWPKV